MLVNIPCISYKSLAVSKTFINGFLPHLSTEKGIILGSNPRGLMAGGSCFEKPEKGIVFGRICISINLYVDMYIGI